jgi:FdhD protein
MNRPDLAEALPRAPEPPYRPEMSDAGLKPAHAVTAVDEYGERREGLVAGERPLTLFLDDREIVTLMTLGTHPEMLTLGYLLNQRLVPCLESVESVAVDWDREAVRVVSYEQVADLESRLRHRTVTAGCAQGTVFGRVGENLERLRLPSSGARQSRIYALLDALSEHNDVYRRAGAVHGCALCRFEEDGTPFIDLFVEDVGRHNAADAIAGFMWLNGIKGRDRLFYTTGRLTSEMVIKVAQMGIAVLLSRSGVTYKGLDLAHRVGVMTIARAKGRHFLIYTGAERMQFDAPPPWQGAGRRGGAG